MISVKGSGLLLVAGILLLVGPMAQAEDHDYVGSRKCRKCHAKEYRSWQETAMTKSFELLKPGVRAEQKVAAGLDAQKDYTKDAECLPCHTTGYGEKSGFVSIEKTPDLAGVGCETCHGPGGTYIKDGYMTLDNKEYKKADLVAVGMVSQTNAETCTSLCHNNKSPFVGDDYIFDYENKKHEGIHEIFALKYKH